MKRHMGFFLKFFDGTFVFAQGLQSYLLKLQNVNRTEPLDKMDFL